MVSAGSASADLAAPVFDPHSVAQIELTLSPESRAALDADPSTYVAAGFRTTIAGTTYDDTVGLRLKGSTSFRDLDHKAAFKVKFKEFGAPEFLGLKKLALNNMVQDPSMIRETLAYEVFRAAGVAAPRTGYAFVRVNDDAYGLYVNVETYDKVMLPAWFAATKHLYEGGTDLDVNTPSIDLFQIDEGSSADRTDLAALVAAVDGAGTPFSERLATVADLDEIVRMMAVDRYLGDWDGYMAPSPRIPNNYYLHSDGSGRFTLHPWGADQTFYERSPPELPGGRLFVLCLADPVCAARYDAFMSSLPALVASLGLHAQAATLQSELADSQALDPRSEHSPGEIAAGVDGVRNFIAVRPGDLAPAVSEDDQPADPPPAGAPETSILHGPDGPRATKRRHLRVRFAFESSQPGSRFDCRLDAKPWSGCESPKRVRVDRGRHRFLVRAIGAGGEVDGSPASWRWRVKRR